jgi:hypothetical protein
MPDGGFDPFAAAGMVQAPDGTYVTPQSAPAAPVAATPTQPAGGAVDLAGNPVSLPANLPQVNLPQISTPAPAPTPDDAVIDVGSPRAATPNLDATMARLRAQAGAAKPLDAPAATPSAQPVKAFDPFAAAGMVQAPDGTYVTPQNAASTTPAPAATPAVSPPQVAAADKEPWQQALYDKVISIAGTTAGATHSLTHGLTQGLDEIAVPLPSAIYQSLSQGIPFAQAYEQAVQQMRAPRTAFEAAHPAAGTALEVVGGMPAMAAAGPLFGAAGEGASLLARGANAARSIATGTALGGATGFTMTDGGIAQRLEGAKQGAELAGGLGSAAEVAAPVLKGLAGAAATGLRPAANVDRMAGQLLLERAGGTAPAMSSAPIPMSLDVAQASNNPGLAAQARLVNQQEPIGANLLRAGQNESVRQAATAPQMLPGAAGSVPRVVPAQLAESMHPAEASANVVKGMQDAYAVLKDNADRLWQRPSIATKVPDIDVLKHMVSNAIEHLPTRLQNALAKSSDVMAALNDLQQMPAGATLPDINAIRSDILEASRSLPFSERFAKRAADKVAAVLLKAIEENPALKNDPAAWKDYVEARDSTRRMWGALEKPQFQNMLQAAGANRKGIDPGTVAGQMYNFAKGTEKTPGGLTAITDMLGDIERQWHALGSADLDPAAAASARNALASANRDFIVNTWLDSALSNTRDVSSGQNTIMNKLSDWIDTNKGWLTRSGQFNQDQISLMENIKEAAVMAARTENLRGGPGSPTYELLKGDRFVDAFLGPVLGRAISTGGGVALCASLTALFGENAIGGMIGAELTGAALGGGAGHAGQSLLQRLYEAPRQAIIDRIQEAVRNPQFAHDLMMKATTANAKKMNPATGAFLRAALAMQPAGQAMRAYGPDDKPPGAPQ